jgi:hypothetical protein
MADKKENKIRLPRLSIAMVFLAFTFLFFSGTTKITQGAGDYSFGVANVTGYAWSSNFGWLSFNCNHPETPSNTCGTVNYGVNINTQSDGNRFNLSGHAWSPNAGWLSFQYDGASYPPPDNWGFNTNCDASSPCTGATNCTACYNPANGKIFGWARVVNLNNDGWIKLATSSMTVPYQVVVDQLNASGTFSGFGWGGNTDFSKGLGWLSFNCSNTGTCGAAYYSVYLLQHHLPKTVTLSAPNLGTTTPCSTGVVKQASLWWSNNGITPIAYQVVVNNSNSTSTGSFYDTGRRNISGISSFWVSSSNALMTYGAHLYWWVRIWDDFGFRSAWRQFDTAQGDTLTDNASGNASGGNSKTFTNFLHEFPKVNFTYTPTNPLAYNPVTSTDASVYYTAALPNEGSGHVNCWHNSAPFCTYYWNAGKMLSNSATTSSSTVMTFKYSNSALIKLKITDPEGNTCVSSTPGFLVDLLPSWKENKAQ